MALLEYLAANPRAGDLIPENWQRAEAPPGARRRGKSAGVRAIYYFHSDAMPLYLLTVFGKNERADLTAAERNELAGLARILKATMRSAS